MTDDLKRCPFCGGEPKVFYHDTKWFGPTWHIECLDDNCGCGTCHHDSAEIAATVWNRRIEAKAAEINIAKKVIVEQLQARKEQADEIEKLRKVIIRAVEIVNDQMPGEFLEWEMDAKSALGETDR